MEGDAGRAPQTVARMERSGMRVVLHRIGLRPGFRSLHPGYDYELSGWSLKMRIAMASIE